jgi:hypothetical protein
MRLERLLAVSALCWAVLAPYAIAQSETNPPAQVEPPGRPARQRPGEYPDYLFHEPYPAPTVKTGDDFQEKYLFGDWLGARSRLADEGIKPLVLFITDPFVNASGGRRQGFSEYDLLGIDVLVDTDKLLGWPGGEFRVGFANNSGTSLSTHYVGNNFPVQLADVASANPRLTYLSYTKSLFDDKLSVRFGRLTINSVYGEEFAGSQYFKAFTSVAFDLVPLGIFLNAPGAFGYPLTTWGARVKYEPVESFYAMAGCYNGDPAVKEGDRHGVDFTLRGARICHRRGRLPPELRQGCHGSARQRETWRLLQRRQCRELRLQPGRPAKRDSAGSLRLLCRRRSGTRSLGRPGGKATPGRLRRVRERPRPTRQPSAIFL